MDDPAAEPFLGFMRATSRANQEFQPVSRFTESPAPSTTSSNEQGREASPSTLESAHFLRNQQRPGSRSGRPPYLGQSQRRAGSVTPTAASVPEGSLPFLHQPPAEVPHGPGATLGGSGLPSSSPHPLHPHSLRSTPVRPQDITLGGVASHPDIARTAAAGSLIGQGQGHGRVRGPAEHHVYEEVGPPDLPNSPRGQVARQSPHHPWQGVPCSTASPVGHMLGQAPPGACACHTPSIMTSSTAPSPHPGANGPPPHPLSASSQPCVHHPPQMYFSSGGPQGAPSGHGMGCTHCAGTLTSSVAPPCCSMQNRSMSQATLVTSAGGHLCHDPTLSAGSHCCYSSVAASQAALYGPAQPCEGGLPALGAGRSTCTIHCNNNNDSSTAPGVSRGVSPKSRGQTCCGGLLPLCWPLSRLLGKPEKCEEYSPQELGTLSADVDRNMSEASDDGKQRSNARLRKCVIGTVVALLIIALSTAAGMIAAYAGGGEAEGTGVAQIGKETYTLGAELRIIGGPYINFTQTQLTDKDSNSFKLIYWDLLTKVDGGFRAGSVSHLYNQTQITRFSQSQSQPLIQHAGTAEITAHVHIRTSQSVSALNEADVAESFSRAMRVLSLEHTFRSSFLLEESSIDFQPDYTQPSSEPEFWEPLVTANPFTTLSSSTTVAPVAPPTTAPTQCVPAVSDLCRPHLQEGNGSMASPNLVNLPPQTSRNYLDYLLSASKCNHTMYERFLCSVLSPVCHNSAPVPPCRSFCEEVTQCQSWDGGLLANLPNCSAFPESNDPDVCTPSIMCEEDQFRCDNKCIQKHSLCDNYKDCPSGFDESEEVCRNHQCTDRQFVCSNGKCAQGTWVCDGEPDCSGGEDEDRLEVCAPHGTCSNGTFQCSDGLEPRSGGAGGACLEFTFVCDSKSDCQDGSDEKVTACIEKGTRFRNPLIGS